MRPLALNDSELRALKRAAATLPPEQRSDFLTLFAASMGTTDGAFGRALSHALNSLHDGDGCCCSR
jgi:hypothetical protein